MPLKHTIEGHVIKGISKLPQHMQERLLSFELDWEMVPEPIVTVQLKISLKFAPPTKTIQK